MKILEKQQFHLIILIFLLLGVLAVAKGDVLDGSLWNIPTRSWLWLSILMPVVHQIYVVICWRAELYYQALSKTFGNIAFSLWSIGFMILFLSRPVLIVGLAVANRNTLNLSIWVAWILSALFIVLVGYLAYSIGRYFGIKRALGLDHFQPDVYKNQAMVNDGIFKWTANPMYIFGFLILWIPGLLLYSKAALLAALFNHLYIWAHYYFTEIPDMKYIYSEK